MAAPSSRLDTKLPAVRLQPLQPGTIESDEGAGEDAVIVELPPSTKFAFTWPSNLPISPTLPNLDQSSFPVPEEDTVNPTFDLSPPSTHKKTSSDELEDVPAYSTLPGRDTAENSLSLPKISRAFSSPTPAQLGQFRNPRRVISENEWNPKPLDPTPNFEQFHDLSLELADSVQTVVQTLLQVCPPQVLDTAKEQFSGCSISVPTTSMSAILTSMKNLNYVSGHMCTFGFPSSTSPAEVAPQNLPAPVMTHFDIGEMLQAVGDSLGGLAAQAGIDLVLFHQDVGMKHVAVKGHESCLSYLLSYIVRQVIGTAGNGDYVEIGLFIESVAGEVIEDAKETDGSNPTAPPPPRLRCTFYIAHRFSSAEANYRPTSTPPSPTIPQNSGQEATSSSDRPPLVLNNAFVSRLLQQIGGGEFVTNLKPQLFSEGRGSELVITLDHGLIEDPPANPDFMPCASLELSPEPTLQELAAFSETLRGKKVTLCASSRGSFANHLSSYLTAWGLDVSHYALDPLQSRSSQDSDNDAAFFQPLTGPSTPQTSLVLIDDNIEVLKESLQAIKTETNTQNQPSPKPRPSLMHRPKSTPQLLRGLPNLSRLVQNTTIVHFTSLTNYKSVKDIVQSSIVASQKQLPEVLVIPKPAGPRRVLTALYTALKKPIVDPFFSPIATSPATPSSRNPSFYFPHDQQKGKQGSRPSVSSRRTDSDKSTKTQGDREYAPVPPSPLSVSDSIEYFSESTMKLGTSPSSGLVLQSPDGQPAGIFFLPKSGGLGIMPSKTTTQTPTMERDRGQFVMTSRRPSEDAGVHGNDTPRRSPRTQITPNTTEPPNAADRQSNGDYHQGTRSIKKVDTQVEGTPQKSSTPPVSPGTRGPGTNNRRSSNGRRSTGDPKSTQKDPKIVPPISVLIVDDNPINQTILSTFMKKKKIKYDVARNGQEAVQKWKSGGFHLILMDIQMPVMDGIQATKEIRRLEKMSGAPGFPNSPTGTPTSEGQRTPPDSASESRQPSTPFRSSVIIVALTASSLQTDRVAALTAGCNDFLTKPVSLQWLNSKIIEWGSIKALQMWADIRPEFAKGFTNGQQEKAQTVAKKLHMPEGRIALDTSRSRSASLTQPPPGPSRMAQIITNPTSETEESARGASTDPRESASPGRTKGKAGGRPAQLAINPFPEYGNLASGSIEETPDTPTPKQLVAEVVEKTPILDQPAHHEEKSELPSAPPIGSADNSHPQDGPPNTDYQRH